MSRLVGTPEEKRAEAERVVQAIVPEAKCQIRGHDNQIECGLLDTDDRAKSFMVLLKNLDTGILESHARMLKERLRQQR